MNEAVQIDLGLEVCIEQRPSLLDGARFGLLMNQASIDCHFRYACDVLAEAYPGQLTALFSPQHGFWGEQQANMIETAHGRHPRLGVPIYSLYSETRRPTPAMLADLDCFVVDLQDVGTRVYTFAWSVKHCLEACADAGLPVLLLDRPNPVGGAVEGPLLDPDYHSFVGEASIPMRHGLTLGELASLINVESSIQANLTVVPMRHWKRALTFQQTSRAWIPPTPNLPRFESALVYPGQVLFEGTNLSEGRGTTMPFEVAGAPYVDAERLVRGLTALDLPGIRFLPIRFQPIADKWASESCGGVFLHVTDVTAHQPYRTALAILSTIRSNHPVEFAWSDPPYEYETARAPIDVISGSSALRERLSSNARLSEAELSALAFIDNERWLQRIAPHLLYAD